jgi:hypothetical protein
VLPPCWRAAQSPTMRRRYCLSGSQICALFAADPRIASQTVLCITEPVVQRIQRVPRHPICGVKPEQMAPPVLEMISEAFVRQAQPCGAGMITRVPRCAGNRLRGYILVSQMRDTRTGQVFWCGRSCRKWATFIGSIPWGLGISMLPLAVSGSGGAVGCWPFTHRVRVLPSASARFAGALGAPEGG